MFKHYLITRFNLRNPKWNFTKNNELLLTEEWMENRMNLFKNFCFPSIVSQTNKNFTWLLFFDITTSEKFKLEINNIVAKHENFNCFFIDGMDHFYPEIIKYIKKDSIKFSHLITSRIDNDDCIHKNFINEVQKKFTSQNYQAIDIIKGYTLQIEPKFILGKKEHIFNPFISLIEKNEAPETVWSKDHTQWKKESRITQITHDRLWLSIIHGKNKVNKFDGYDNVKWETINSDFIVSDEINKTIKFEQIDYKNWRKISFKNKIEVKFNLFSKKIKKILGVYKIKHFTNK